MSTRQPAAAVGAADASRPRWAWPASVATAATAVALGAPLVVLAATGDELRHPALAAALRTAWIGLYAGVGLWFARRRRHWQVGLVMTALALVAAIGALDALPGPAAYTIAQLTPFALIPLSLLMLVALPEVWRVRARLGAPLILAAAALVVLSAAYLMVAETAAWATAAAQCRGPCAGSAIQVADAPALARAILVVMAALTIAVMAAVALGLVRVLRTASPITARTVRPIAWLTVVWSAPLYPGVVVLAADPGPDRLTPFLVTTALIRAALPLGLAAVVVVQAIRTGEIGEELMSRLADATDPVQVQRAIAEVLRDPTVRLAFRDGAGWIDVEGRPIADATPEERGWIAMSLAGGRAGALSFDPGLHTQEERVQAIVALGSVALERARAEAELRAVRRRLVAVADQERRRIERNLHDGAQQRLVGMAIRMSAARDALAEHPERALALLRELGADVQQALDELRDLAHGLHPPVLVDHGIAEALRSAARHAPTAVELRLGEVGRLDALQEAAVYFCCAEALQNASKHGGADPRTVVRLWREDDLVAFEVSDEGPGFVVGPLRPGTGLMGMRDRLEAVGGTLAIDSAPGRGTRVSGRLPVGRAATDDAVERIPAPEPSPPEAMDRPARPRARGRRT